MADAAGLFALANPSGSGLWQRNYRHLGIAERAATSCLTNSRFIGQDAWTNVCNTESDCFVWIENLRELLGVQIRLSVMTD
ncbi:Arm DNA-binding domain-containing protein [Ruegeria marisrubri]|uniref:Arm DNA-binding domain-containing protein n=1 Tax=Ruegeria marisrubri TaxID=1685379 RepID=UPI001CD3A907|nr:Arm DNA-binding domain-containing protein [Ruegeria marisrubri]MCA0908068.1 Arm DNA-binding domain-containing protein [Ruegeria marisrubri]